MVFWDINWRRGWRWVKRSCAPAAWDSGRNRSETVEKDARARFRHNRAQGGGLACATDGRGMRTTTAFLLLLTCGGAGAAADRKAVVLRVLKHDVSPPLREMAARVTGTLPAGAGLRVAPNASDPGLGLNFAGIAADVDTTGTPPPDTNGAAGATQFVQWVGNVYAVFNKDNGSIELGPFPGNNVWTGFGGACETNNSGQPIAQYDKNAGRWVLAQPVLVTPYTYCIAVSNTSDATESYFRYAFALTLPSGGTPDSPKLAVWPDAYYTSFNIIENGNVTGALAIAYDRVNMLDGGSRQPVAFTLGSTETYILPSDWDGATPPSSGEPDFYMNVGAPSTLNLYQFHVNFDNPGDSTFSGPVAIKVKPPTAASDPDVCTRKPGHCDSITQPSQGVLLDALPNELMYRLAWRKLNGKEHLLTNQTVFGSGSVAFIEWYDITNPDGTPAVAQQGSVSNATTNYWMGSIAEDKMGDMAIGFSASSTSLFPSIEFVGRLATDTKGTTGPTEPIATGTNVQESTPLWGAYSSMSMDPSDDCTFWYTTEFIQTPPSGSTANWSTWIASLKFPACP